MNNNERNKINKQNYECKIFINYQGCKFKVLKYINQNNIFIEFCDKYKNQKKVNISQLKDKEIRNPYYPDVYGKGFTGNIPTREKDKKGNYNGKHTKEYNTWKEMIKRCYSDRFQKDKRPTYKGCEVKGENFLCFEFFVKWLKKQSNYKKWLTLKRSALDKDILVKGNKIYSVNTCCLVPNEINTVFSSKTHNKSKEGIGIVKTKNNKYRAYCNQKHSPLFNTKEEAFVWYKNKKENHIKELARKHYNLGNITKQCYEAMMKYEVNIND